MIITRKAWTRYIGILRRLNEKAADEMTAYRDKLRRDGISEDEAARLLVDYAYGIATKYGEGAAAASCEMYDAVATLSKAKVPAAVPAATATRADVSKAVYGTINMKDEVLPSAIARLVKRAGADTTIKNAIRDKAEWAWIPNGDTCSFCIALASQGWMPASKDQLDGGHAEHIHSNCDCTFAIRFNGDIDVAGYDPEKYRDMYYSADPGGSSKDKINAMRREAYQDNKDKINAQKRDAYEKRKERESSEAEEINVG